MKNKGGGPAKKGRREVLRKEGSDIKAIFLQYCELWGKKTCPSEKLRKLYKNKILQGKKFKLPNGEELNNLNEICSNCTHALYIKEKKCPVCEGNDLHAIVLYLVKIGSMEIYNYECTKCGRNLYSTKKFS